MGPFSMVVLIVTVVMIAQVLKARYRAQGAGTCADPGPGRADPQVETELRQLKARVATLERIVTDRSSTLDQEIEALRDRS